MKALFLLLSIILIFSCKADSSKEKLKTILLDHKPSEQIFKVESEGFVSVVGKKGTRIKLNTDDLIFENGNKVEFPFEIVLLELTTIEDLIKANAQTVSNGKWLISGGAFKIQAIQNGKKLQLKEGANYKVSFPKISEEEMSVFYGKRNIDGNMNWNLSNIKLKEKKYPSIIVEDSSFMKYDTVYQIDMQHDTTMYRKPKNKYSTIELSKKFPRIDSVALQNDTLYGFIKKRWWVESVPTNTMTDKEIDSIVLLNNKLNELYEEILLNKFDWINVDRFYQEITERNEVLFELSENFEYAVPFVYMKEQNTFLNQNFNDNGSFKMDFPKDISFNVVVVGIREDKVYAFKRLFRANKNKTIIIKMKEIRLEEINELLK